jgi:hypothetical protein
MMHESPVEPIAQESFRNRPHAEQIVPGAIPQDGGDDVLQVGGPVGT